MSMEMPCVVHVERTMLQMSFGFVVTYVKSGFMGSVLRSLLLEQSTSSNISAPHATTREQGLDITRRLVIVTHCSCVKLDLTKDN